MTPALVGFVGLPAFVLGLVMLATTENLGFDAGSALAGIASQLSITLPAALLILAATALEVGAGVILARAARRRPFDSLAEILVSAMVAAVLKDTLLLGLLGGFGLFRAPVLIGLDIVLVAGAILPASVARHVRPVMALGSWRVILASIGSWPAAVLVAIVWAGPVVLQLASPVVPFIDVLPNHVAPVEHLRTFGWFSPLTATQSPIFGPSRTVLGYDGLLGVLATMTNLPGGLAIAGFIAPLTVLLAAGAYRFAGALRDRGSLPIGAWALLTFALSQPFARLTDARGTVVVVPLVCAGLALAADALRRSDVALRSSAAVFSRSDDPWRIGRGAAIGLALGAAALVHPVIAFLAMVTIGVAALARPRHLAAEAFVAMFTAGLIALPQLATMVGLSLPTIMLGVWLPLSIVVGVVVGRLIAASLRLRDGFARAARIGRIVVVLAAVGTVGSMFAVSFLNVDGLPAALETTLTLTQESSGLLLIVLIVGALLGNRGAHSPLVVGGLGAGVAAVVLVQLLAGDLGLLGDALRFEVPKTAHYWLSLIAAAGAAVALAHVWTAERLARLARVALVAVFVAIAALPLRPKPIDAYHLGEHRWSETFAIDLKFAGSGFWLGFPDSRSIVDTARQQILDVLRVEIDAGRLQHDTPVLHYAYSFQQWVGAPLGVFDGVTETFVSLDAEVSHHTVGGRLFRFGELPVDVAWKTFPYIVLEPDGLPFDMRELIVDAGYVSIFANEQGEVFRPAP